MLGCRQLLSGLSSAARTTQLQLSAYRSASAFQHSRKVRRRGRELEDGCVVELLCLFLTGQLGWDSCISKGLSCFIAFVVTCTQPQVRAAGTPIPGALSASPTCSCLDTPHQRLSPPVLSAGAGPSLQQAPAPADDPTGFSLTTTELEQLGGLVLVNQQQGVCSGVWKAKRRCHNVTHTEQCCQGRQCMET